MSTGRRKKGKFIRSQSRDDRLGNDPAYTSDVRHLALPLRRNSSGPEISTRFDIFSKMDFSSSGGNKSEPLRGKKTKKKRGTPSEGCNIYEKYRSLKSLNSSSEDDGLIEENRRQRSSEWRLNFKNEYSSGPNRKSRSSSDYILTHSLTETNCLLRNFKKRFPKPQINSTNSSTIPRRTYVESRKGTAVNDAEDEEQLSSSGQSAEDLRGAQRPLKFEKLGIGKRFLSGEIGIKSFNYYLIKEGLKSTDQLKSNDMSAERSTKLTTEENIYEEIYFLGNDNRRLDSKYHREHKGKGTASATQRCRDKYCELCTANNSQTQGALSKRTKCSNSRFNPNSSDFCYDGECEEDSDTIYARIRGGRSVNAINNYAEIGEFYDHSVPSQRGGNHLGKQPVLQFHSYNPDTGVFKMEITPIAVPSDLNQLVDSEVIFREKAQSVTSGKSPSTRNDRTMEETFGQPRTERVLPSRNVINGEAFLDTSTLNKEPYSNNHKSFGIRDRYRLQSNCQQCLEIINYSSAANTNFPRECDCPSSYFSSDFDENPPEVRTTIKRSSRATGKLNSSIDCRSLQPTPDPKLCQDCTPLDMMDTKKKLFIEDRVSIPNEVVYNLSYGMIRPVGRQNESTDPEQQKMHSQGAQSSRLHIYEKAQKKNALYICGSPNCDDIPTVKIRTQPIYNSPKKVRESPVAKSCGGTGHNAATLGGDNCESDCVEQQNEWGHLNWRSCPSQFQGKLEFCRKPDSTQNQKASVNKLLCAADIESHNAKESTDEKTQRAKSNNGKSSPEKYIDGEKALMLKSSSVAVEPPKCSVEEQNAGSFDADPADKDSVEVQVLKKIRGPEIKLGGFIADDLSDLPLPELPTKKTKNRRGDEHKVDEVLKRQPRNSSLPRNYFRQRNEPQSTISARKQQRIRNSSAEDLLSLQSRPKMGTNMNSVDYESYLGKPRYFFGEVATLQSSAPNLCLSNRSGLYLFGDRNDASKDIFLNKSGWVQVKQRNDNVVEPKTTNSSGHEVHSKKSSKIEDLILRNEARKIPGNSNVRQKSNLPTTTNTIIKLESSIISPPPAFQDVSKLRVGLTDPRINVKMVNLDLPKEILRDKNVTMKSGNSISANQKGMVASRSFELENKNGKIHYPSTHSKSFEYDLSPTAQTTLHPSTPLLQMGRASTFSNLTGNSPNYLSKKESDTNPGSHQRSNYTGSLHAVDSGVIGETQSSRNTCTDLSHHWSHKSKNTPSRGLNSSTESRRLNSWDSGTRSDFSDDGECDSEKLIKGGSIRKQRSLTPNIERPQVSSVKKRSTTPKGHRKLVAKPSTIQIRDYDEDDKMIEGKSLESSHSLSSSNSSSNERIPTKSSIRLQQYNKINNNVDIDARIQRSWSLQLPEGSLSMFKDNQQLEPPHRNNLTIRLSDQNSSNSTRNPSTNSDAVLVDCVYGNSSVGRRQGDAADAKKSATYWKGSINWNRDKQLESQAPLYVLGGPASNGYGNKCHNIRPESSRKQNEKQRGSSPSRDPEDLNENEQFYHLKKLLSTANAQHCKSYSFVRKGPVKSSEPTSDPSTYPISKRAPIMQSAQSFNERSESFALRDSNRSLECDSSGLQIKSIPLFTEQPRPNLVTNILIDTSLKINPKPKHETNKSIVHINSQKYAEPYCCTGNDMKSNQIRVVVNQRKVKNREFVDRIHILKTNYRTRCASLPTLAMRRRAVSHDKVISLIRPTNQLQLRTVSSPSLTDCADTPRRLNEPREYTNSKSKATGTCATVVEVLHDNSENCRTTNVEQCKVDATSSNGNAGVFHKVRKTLSQLKGKQSTNDDQGPLNEITITTGTTKAHRFGPLIWRSSKERGKVVNQRRNKCNSGDSGILVESENDDLVLTVAGSSKRVIQNVSEARNINVRRSNSVTAGKPTQRESSDSKESNQRSTLNDSAKARSLSQPSDLNMISHDNDMDSDSASDEETPVIDEQMVAEVVFPFQPGGPEELALPIGALVEVLKQDAGPWWWGRLKTNSFDPFLETRVGWFPKDFVRMSNRQGVPPLLLSQSVNSASCSTFVKMTHAMRGESPYGSQTTREHVIKELLETEINYVKLLSSLCTGFLTELRNCSDVFPTSSLDLIFSNVEEIFQFQQSFLDALTSAIKTQNIAEVFIGNASRFMIYSIYCNAYARALNELENFAQNKEALLILENCRKRERLPELPLQAHLLAPIQRICKYPLHLIELVKHSPRKSELPQLGAASGGSGHDCKEIFESALSAMRHVAEMVNEGKRNSEYLMCLQQKLDNFKGPPLNVHSTRVFLEIDAIRMSPNLWNNTYTLFLFDYQLVMAKRDLLKRNQFLFKGRIFLDCCRILNLPNGKIFGITLKNALRVYCDVRGKWYDFCFRTLSHKMRFLNMLAVERQFSGKSLFLAELADTIDDDDVADGQTMIVNYNNDVSELESDNFYNPDSIDQHLGSSGSLTVKPPPPNYKKLNKKYNSETLPKKSKRCQQGQLHLNRQPVLDLSQQAFGRTKSECDSASLGRSRRIGNWFRKVKSTSNTPSQSPTPQMTSTVSLVAPCHNALVPQIDGPCVNGRDDDS